MHLYGHLYGALVRTHVLYQPLDMLLRLPSQLQPRVYTEHEIMNNTNTYTNDGTRNSPQYVTITCSDFAVLNPFLTCNENCSHKYGDSNQ